MFKNTNISNSNIQTIINKIKIVPGAGGGVAGGALRAPARVREPRARRAGGGAAGAGGGKAGRRGGRAERAGGGRGRRRWGSGARVVLRDGPYRRFNRR